MKYIELRERNKDEILNILFDKQCELIGLTKDIKLLENKINEISNYLEQRKEEWDNCQDRENIKSCHYIKLIRDLLEIIDKENKE